MTCKPFVQTLAVSLMLQQLNFFTKASYLAIIKSNAFFPLLLLPYSLFYWFNKFGCKVNVCM